MSAVGSVRNSPTSFKRRISEDPFSQRKESQKPNCLFLYKTSKTDTVANKQRSPHPAEQDEAKEAATWQREKVSYKQKFKEQEDTIKAILKENHELLNSNNGLKKKVNELTKIHMGNSKTEEKIQSSSSKIEQKKEDVKVDGKPTIVIAGDSIVKDVKEWLMSRDKRLKVNSFSGANIEDMEDFLTPIIRRKPDEIILHVGTNDLQNDSPGMIANNILKLAQKIENQCYFVNYIQE